MTQPTIAIASAGLGHVARGIETWAADLAAALDRRGLPVRLYRGGGPATRAYERVVANLPRDGRASARLRRCVPRRLAWRVGLGGGYQTEQLTFAVALLRHLRRDRIDVLHVQDPLLAAVVQRARALGLVRTRAILGHGTEESDGFLASIDYVQHLAPWHLADSRARGVGRPTWAAIPNFVDTERFAPGDDGRALRDELGLPADAIVIFTAAAVKRGHKRIDHLVREFAAARDARPDAPLYLVVAGGREAETDELIAWGRGLLGDRVRFLVGVARDRMPQAYRAADAFVLTSLKEMMPIALLEAGASGLPCLTHAHPVLEWMAGPGGVAVDMATPGELALALTRLIDRPDERHALGHAARVHVQATFGRDRVVDQILRYYEAVLGSDAPATAADAADAGRAAS